MFVMNRRTRNLRENRIKLRTKKPILSVYSYPNKENKGDYQLQEWLPVLYMTTKIP